MMKQIGAFTSALVLMTTALLWSGHPLVHAADSDLEAVKKQFVGHWELVSYISYTAEGGEVDNHYEGRITYDEHDNMTALGMPKDLPARAAADRRNASGGFSYYGHVTWDIENRIVTHHVTGSPSRGSWVGEDNVRHYEFVDGLLKLAMKNAQGRTIGVLTWRKLG